MTEPGMEDVLRNLDRRMGEVLQILPTLATKTEIQGLATKTDLESLATKTEIQGLATKTDLESLATKSEIQGLATKTDLEDLATQMEVQDRATRDELLSLASKEELQATRDRLRHEIREEGKRSRRHMDVVAEALSSQIRLFSESVVVLEERERGHHDEAISRIAVLEHSRPYSEKA